MSATFYDKALLEKIQKWIKDPNVKIIGVDETRRLWTYRLDQNDDKPLQLPLISLSRSSNMTIKNVSKQPLTYDGFRPRGTLLRDKNGNISGKVEQINGIPIRLEYQLDIYTRYYEEAEEYIRNFIFNLINYPKVKITLPYNSYYQEKICSITLDPTVVDNSSIPERLEPGQFTRKTITLYIDDAYLWDVRTRDTYRIEENEVCVDVKLQTDLDIKIENQGEING